MESQLSTHMSRRLLEDYGTADIAAVFSLAISRILRAGDASRIHKQFWIQNCTFTSCLLTTAKEPHKKRWIHTFRKDICV